VTEVLKLNQQMVTDWKKNCATHDHLAFCMLALNKNNGVELYRAQPITNAILITLFEKAIKTLKEQDNNVRYN